MFLIECIGAAFNGKRVTELEKSFIILAKTKVVKTATIMTDIPTGGSIYHRVLTNEKKNPYKIKCKSITNDFLMRNSFETKHSRQIQQEK